VAKPAHAIGVGLFWLNYLRGRHTRLIEYKEYPATNDCLCSHAVRS
jgi:hypothetical protein